MNQSKFEVYTPLKREVIGTISLLLLCLPCYFGLVHFTEKYPLGFIMIFLVLLFICDVAVVCGLISAILWRIKVDGTKIEVRTGYGKQYSFQVTDIKKVVSGFRHNYRVGDYPVIAIHTETKYLEIPAGRKGFVKIVEYLLEKSESGEISDSAMSESTKTSLEKYRDNEFYKKVG